MNLQHLFLNEIMLQIIGPGSGRLGVTSIGLIGLLNLIIAIQAYRRLGRGIDSRTRAIVALILGLIVAVLALIHFVTTSGPFGTGNGRAGAIVAMLVGLSDMILGTLVLVRRRK